MNELVTKSEDSFRRGLRHIGLAYFEQRVVFLDFIQEMNRLLAFHYSQAWEEGEKACGFTAAERTDEQRQRLQSEVARDMQSVYGLASHIESQHARQVIGDAGKRIAWASVSSRLDLWANRYNAVRAAGQTIVCADRKMVWYLGRTEKHCTDCLGYEGRVYRASTWRGAGAMPQSRRLECGGWHCDCRLVPTDAPAMPGRPPSPRGG